jgi:hypothetical protein
MECAFIQERLSEYIDGTLDADDRKVIENHISTCKTCKEDLASLTEMVEELHAMDPVEAPADFLEKIHERMESRSGLDRIIRKLFIPFRIKIPLELAAAATITVLVFFVFNVQQKEIPSVQTLSDSISGKMAEKPAEYRMKPAFEKEAKGGAPALEAVPTTPSDKEQVPSTRKSKATTTVRPSIQRESLLPSSVLGKAEEAAPDKKDNIIQIALVLKAGPTGGGSSAGPAMEPARRYKKDETAGGTEGTDSDFFEKNVTADQRGPAPDLLPRVKHIVRRAQGKVFFVEIDGQTDRLTSMDAEIPAQNYPAFCRELNRLATFHTPPRTLSDKDPDTIQVHIGFIYPDE